MGGMTARDVVTALKARYPLPEWVFLDEIRCGTGWTKVPGLNVEQRMDAWAMNCWPSKEFVRLAFEVKVSRSDLLSELKDPTKRASALALSNRFYFTVPEGLMKLSELPDECGLLVVNGMGKIRVVHEAPLRSADPLPTTFVAGILRRALLGKVTVRAVPEDGDAAGETK